MGQFDATKGKQALEIRSSLSERRALTDPILPSNGADMAHTLSRHWAKAHGRFKLLVGFGGFFGIKTKFSVFVSLSRASREHVSGL